MKIITIIGARPQFIKAAVISRNINQNHNIQEILLHTGQHYDHNINDIFFDELNIPAPKYNLNIGSDTHGAQTAKMLVGIENILLNEKPDYVLVYGDTNSTLAGALAAVKLHIPVAHVEAGLRSFNRKMPEELNRIITDSISELLFAPTMTAVTQLEKEDRKDATHFTGDVMYDSVLYYKNQILSQKSSSLPFYCPSEYYLATIHRAENTDDPILLKKIFSTLNELEIPVLFPLHPRTKQKIKSYNIIPGSNLIITEPVGYLHLLELILKSQKVITDSGGVQKEAYFLDTPCVTIREETEWIETLDGNHNILCGTDSNRIKQALLISPNLNVNKNCFGDGHAGEKIIQLLTDKLIKNLNVL